MPEVRGQKISDDKNRGHAERSEVSRTSESITLSSLCAPTFECEADRPAAAGLGMIAVGY
jgi:hypothetical protein